MIHIAVAMDFDRHKMEYDGYLVTLLMSILDNTTEPLSLHLLCLGCPEQEIVDDMRSMLGVTGGKLYLYQVKLDDVFYRLEGSRYWSPAIACRFYLPELLFNIAKVIFLDVDMVFKGDISKLWRMNMKENVIAGVHLSVMDFKRDSLNLFGTSMENQESIKCRLEKRINGGVILMDLESMRKKNDLVREARAFVVKYPKILSFDEMCLNFIFGSQTMLLDAKWNYSIRNLDYDAEAMERQAEIVCLHFDGSSKPLKQSNGVADYFFWKYFRRTKFYREEDSIHYFEAIYHLRSMLEEIHQFYTSLRVHKKLAVFGTGHYAEFIVASLAKKIFV